MFGSSESAFKSWNGKYVCAEPDGTIIANRDHKSKWEMFKVEDLGNQNIALKSHHGKYVSACGESCGYAVNANRENREKSEVFKVEEQHDGVSLKTSHNRYVTAEPNGTVKADRLIAQGWETFGPEK